MVEAVRGPYPEAPMPEPSVENWDTFSELLWLAFKKPKQFEEKVAFKLALAEAHKLNSKVMRLRSAKYDVLVEARREEWVNFITAIAATCRMQAGLAPPRE